VARSTPTPTPRPMRVASPAAMPWWTEVRGISEYPNESSRAAVSIADDGEAVMGFSRRRMSIACVEVPAMTCLLWPRPMRFPSGVVALIVSCGGQGNITPKG
jgi:hypothetical protein